jgi:SMC interacting uncharacterized protein involved in chromosome segregation
MAQGEEFIRSTSESIQSIYELVTRIDERVNTLMKKHDELDAQIDDQKIAQSQLETRMTVFEAQNPKDAMAGIGAQISQLQSELIDIKTRIQLVEISSQGSEQKWNKLANYFLQLLWLVLAGWVLYKLGLPAP